MNDSRKRTYGSPRRNFLKTAAGITAGTVLTRGTGWAQGSGATAKFPKIKPRS